MERKKALWSYIVASIFYICAVIANLTIQQWFRYCYWDFGLVYAESFTTIRDFSEENSIVDVIGDTCGSLQKIIEETCPNVCTHIGNFKSAGIIMIAFAGTSCIFAIFCIFFHIRILADTSIRLKTITFFMILPFINLLIGISSFVGIGSFVSISSQVTQKNNSQNFVPKIGMYAAFGNLVLALGIFVFGFKTTRKFISKKFE